MRKLKDFIKYIIERMRVMIDKYEFKPRPAEADEIDAIKSSGKPKIDMEFICDWFIGLWELETKNKKTKSKSKPRRTKKKRISVEK